MQQPTLIRNDVYWLGTPNPDLRVFDVVMRTPFGTSYNSYLIKDAQTAVIDIVKHGHWKLYEQSLRSLIDPSQIDYIVLQHTEPDHSGCLPEMLASAPNAVVVGSRSAITLAEQICNCKFRSMAVKDGDEIDLGGRRLRFISAPFLHWPDTIFTYSPSDRILFTCDFLGAHFRDGNLWLSRSADHDASFKDDYDAIMSPFKPYVLQALEKISPLEIDLVAPSHGPLIHHDIDEFVQRYYDWSKVAGEKGSRSLKRIVVAECSAYGNTRLLGTRFSTASGVRGNSTSSALASSRLTRPQWSLRSRLQTGSSSDHPLSTEMLSAWSGISSVSFRQSPSEACPPRRMDRTAGAARLLATLRNAWPC